MQRRERKQPLIIEGPNGLTTDDGEQSEIIAQHFKTHLNTPRAEPVLLQVNRKLTNELTIDEVRKEIGKMKNNKSAGIDQINVELYTGQKT